jgi:hypothetical protein
MHCRKRIVYQEELCCTEKMIALKDFRHEEPKKWNNCLLHKGKFYHLHDRKSLSMEVKLSLSKHIFIPIKSDQETASIMVNWLLENAVYNLNTGTLEMLGIGDHFALNYIIYWHEIIYQLFWYKKDQNRYLNDIVCVERFRKLLDLFKHENILLPVIVDLVMQYSFAFLSE